MSSLRSRGDDGWGSEDPELDGSALLVSPFPAPGQLICTSIARLHDDSTPLDSQRVAELAEAPRPWDPAACEAPLRQEIWDWLDQVAIWINAQHLWGVDRPGIPSCWPLHPHLVHDLAVLACLRYLARYALTPKALEEWHHYSLPAFLNRIAERLGGACQSGHQPVRPRAERDREHWASLASPARLDRFAADVGEPPSGRS